MNFFVLTLFPDMIESGLNHSILKRASEKGIISVNCIDIREFSKKSSKQVDDYPYGGGAGMVMMPEPVYDAYNHALGLIKNSGRKAKVIYLTPQGKPLTQKTVQQLSKESDLILLCGHYEGIDERVIEEIVTDEISIGDYVLTGGELPAMVLIDCVSRLVPGVLKNEDSHKDESFSRNLLEYPQYTRPYEFNGRAVPDVLLAGHHENVKKWRLEQAVDITRKRRPDLLDASGEDDESALG